MVPGSGVDTSNPEQLICSPDPGPKGMLDFYVRIGIREGGEDEEKSVHGGPDRLCAAPGGERDPGGGDHPEAGDRGADFLPLEKKVRGDGGGRAAAFEAARG